MMKKNDQIKHSTATDGKPPVMARLFKLQITPTITSTPVWIEIMAESASQAQNKYWAVNPTHFICATVDMEENPDFAGF